MAIGLTLRSVKGDTLTYQEMDDNFIYLDTKPTNGTSGTSGVNGASGTSGINGATGSNGTSGTSGISLTDNPVFTGKIQTSSSIRMGDDNEIASISNIGALRYKSDSNNSYIDMVMQTGTSTYEWVNILNNSW